MYAHFCRATGVKARDVQPVATSAIRDASNRREFLDRAREISGLDVRVLSREEEARYGYLAAVNSTTLDHGAVLDLGGGSLQLVRVDAPPARESGSWRLGTVRMTERFLSDEPASRKRPQGPARARARAAGRGPVARHVGRAAGRNRRDGAQPGRRGPARMPACPRWACRDSCSPARRSTSW